MRTILDEIVTTKRSEVQAAQARRPLAELRAVVDDTPRPRNLYQGIVAAAPAGIHIIAEIKERSPSAGLIRADFDPASIARVYEQSGASAISVLTDEPYFGGRLEFLNVVKEASRLPVLRKDFIVDPYQVYESRAAGADAILLIGEVLPVGLLADLMILAGELNLTVLLEVHEMDTLLRVRSLIGFPHERYSLLGINNRNLKIQKTDLSTTGRLAGLVEEGTVLVSESGVHTREDVMRLQQAGARALLVGETLLKASDPGYKLRELLGRSDAGSATST